jgi:2-keto-4-pentenoate hydratase/2-oxohepta-3-ene-1,7-dioic acid hydratase in catechol pathway
MSFDKIVCVGKNYLEHAKELGDAIPDKPVLFLKPPSVLRQAKFWGEHLELSYPSEDSAVQPECEIVLKIACDAYKISSITAKQAISHITLGLDMTLRSRQSMLKNLGHPWTTAKVFKDSAVIGPWIEHAKFDEYMHSAFQLFIDGNLKQQAKGQQMMMQPEDLLVYISHYFPLKAGDIIFTGTPAGVTTIVKGTQAKLCWNSQSFTVSWI